MGLHKEDIREIEKQGKISKGGFDLVLEDVLISSEDIPGWSVATDGPITVALDITITDDLKKEGIARDFVNRVQNLRKDMGLEVLDKIAIEVQPSDDAINAALKDFSSSLQTETQSTTLDIKPSVVDAVGVNMDDVVLKVKIKVKQQLTEHPRAWPSTREHSADHEDLQILPACPGCYPRGPKPQNCWSATLILPAPGDHGDRQRAVRVQNPITCLARVWPSASAGATVWQIGLNPFSALQPWACNGYCLVKICQAGGIERRTSWCMALILAQAGCWAA